MALLRLRRSNGRSRTGKHRSTSDPTYESRIQEALQGLATGQYKTIAAAAKAQNVSRTTLNDRRLATHQSRNDAKAKKQILTPAQELVLAEWCETSAAAANPVHPAKLRGRVKDITGRFPSRNWPRSFLQRHPSLLISRPRNLDPKRAQNFNRSNVAEFFDLQKPLNNVPPQQRWNTDEKGNQMGGGRQNNGMKYIFAEADTNRYRIHSDNLELVTILECVNAAGDKMLPWFVHKNGPPPDIRHLGDKVGGVSFSDSGWTDRQIAVFWLEHHFIPYAKKHRVDPDQPIVLYLDGHDSHESDEFKAVAYRHNLVVCAFPSKTTHKLQPLDVGVFAAVQRAWTKHCDQRLAEGVRIDRYNFIHEYMSIHDVITPELVQKAFKNTGLYPLDLSIFTDVDFAPSLASSITAHVPPSYPPDVPSSPISATDDLTDCDDLDFIPMETDEEIDGMDIASDRFTEDDSPDMGIDAVYEAGEEAPDEPEGHPASPPIPLQTDMHSSPGTPENDQPLAHPPEANQASEHPHDARSQHPMVTRSISTGSTSSNPGPSADSPVILTLTQCMALSKEELCHALQQSYQREFGLLESNQKLQAQLGAANAHCTLAKREVSEVRLQLENAKKARPRQSVKVRGRFVTSSQLKEDFDKGEAERREKEQLEAEKQAKKKAAEGSRQSQIEHDIRNKSFDSLSTFRRKDDYVTLAGALGISRDGTVEELKARIKDYLADPEHADIAQNPRFAALFQSVGKTRNRNLPPNSAPSLESSSLRDSKSHSHSMLQAPSRHDMHDPSDDFSVYDTYGTYDHFSPHDTRGTTYTHFSHYHTFDPSQAASSSNLDRQPPFDVNAGINPLSFSLSNTYNYPHYKP